MAYFVKAVHIQLPHEGGKVPMFEIFGEYLFSESGDAFNVKGIAGRSPPKDWLYWWILSNTFST